MENIYKYCKDYTPLIRCYGCNTCGPSLSNKDIESIVELMLDEALKNHNFNLDDVKLSIVSNIQNISTVQDDLNNYKVELIELLNNYVETNVLEALKNNLENADVDLNNSIQLIKDTLTNNLGTEVINLTNLIDALQISVGTSIADLSAQINSLVPTRDAYEIAKENGYVGSESSWLESLKGKSAYEIAKEHGYSRSESEWLTSLEGKQGPRGLTGERGVPGIDGEDGLNGKDGKDGIDGLSAYELAKKEGFVGSVGYWLQSLKGDRGVGIQKIKHNTNDTLTITYTDSSTYTTGSIRGPQGIQGPEAKSAYDIAKSHGFKGNEKDWLRYILENSETVSDLFADADSLEQFINGDDTQDVLTRLSKRYPTLQKALKELFESGGIAGRFKTLTELQASPLVDGDYALVADDTEDKNGIYIKEDGVWIKSKYDSYTELKKSVYHDDDTSLLRFIDKNGSGYLIVTETADLLARGDIYSRAGRVAAAEDLTQLRREIPVSSDNQNNVLLEIVDGNNEKIVAVDKNANLFIAGDGIYTKQGQLATRNFVEGVARSTGGTTSQLALISMQKQAAVMAMQQTPLKQLTQVSAHKDPDGVGRTKRMPTGIRTKNGFLFFNHRQIAGYNGDSQGSELVKSLITLNPDYSVTVDSQELFMSPNIPSGVWKHPMFGRTKDGRIILVYEGADDYRNGYVQYVRYSSDEGVTFTPQAPLNIVDRTLIEGKNIALGSTGTILTLPSGRLVLPMYNVEGKAFSLYSDDDGKNWTTSTNYVPTDYDFQEPGLTLDGNGHILMDGRPTLQTEFRRRAISRDNGVSWVKIPDTTLRSVPNQGSVFYDAQTGVMLQTHNNIVAGSRTQYGPRTKWTISVSYDNNESYPLSYQPFADNFYGGYNQIIKIGDGVFAVIMEYKQVYAGNNVNEDAGIFIFNLNEAVLNGYNNKVQ